MIEKPVHVSRHAAKRTKDRLGLNIKSAEKNAALAMTNGLTHTETRAKLRRYMDKLYLTGHPGNIYRIYHRNVYIFRGMTMITVIPLPSQLCELADKLQRQKDVSMT